MQTELPRTRGPRLSDEQLETLVEVVFIVCFADGEFGKSEVDRFRARVAQLEDGQAHSKRIDGLMLQAAIRLGKDGRDARLEHAREVLGDDVDARHIALALAVDIAVADGLNEEERSAAIAAADALGISRADLDAMFAR